MRRTRKPGANAADPHQTKLLIVGAARAKKVARAVVVRLGVSGRLGATTKELASLTRYPLRTIQRSVAHLISSGEIVETPVGVALASVYWDLTSDPNPVLGFQNLRFVVSNWRETPPPPCRTAREWTRVSGGSAGDFEAAEFGWDGRRVRLQYFPTTGTLECVIAARTPIPLDRAGELWGWLVAMLGLGQGEEAHVTQIEVNADHRDVRLEQNYLELRDLPRVARVIYQKAEALRHEVRVHQPELDGKPLPLERALELLVEGSPQARAERLLKLEIEATSKQLELARAAPKEAAPERRDPAKVDPGDAADAGFG